MERKAYTEKEQIILAMLVKEKGAAIENKKTDGTTLENKKRAWEEVTKHYNIQPEVNTKRTSHQLRKLWANLRQKKRKETTKIRYERLATGGGLPDKKEEDPVLSMVDEAAPYVDIEMSSTWDSTSIFQSSTAILQESKCEENEAVEPSQEENVEETIQLIFEEASNETARFETPASKRSKCYSGRYLTNQQRLIEENALRVKKLKEGISQQTELHELRMLAAREELAAAKLRRELDEAKLKTFKLQGVCSCKQDEKNI